jgi:uncharacterized delta-60 repeat protein
MHKSNMLRERLFPANRSSSGVMPGSCMRLGWALLWLTGAILGGPTAGLGQSAGSRDLTFGSNGFRTITFGGAYDDIEGMAIGPDGKIVAVGTGGSSNRFAVARFHANGSLDTGFSGDGKLTIDASGGAGGVAVQSDLRILLGLPFYGTPSGFRVCRLNVDGSFDTTFGNGGCSVIATGTQARAQTLVVQPDGRILVGGYDYINGGWDWVIVRFNADGTPDDSFGVNGRVVTNFGRPAIASPIDNLLTLIVLPDGKILAGGSTSTTTQMSTGNRIYAMARYEPNGALDATYADGGQYVFTFSTTTFQTEAVADLELLPDGRILACGGGGLADSTVLRFNPDGLLDTTFGNGGQVVIEMITSNNGFSDLVVDGAGRIIVVGWAYYTSNATSHATMVRLTGEGALDPAFRNGGKVIEYFGTSDESASSVRLTSDGRILMGGDTGYANAQGNWLLARFSNGTPVSLPGGPYDVPAAGEITTIPLDGSGSYDPDGGILTYAWTSDCAGAAFDDPASPSPILTIDTPRGCPVSCTVTLTVTDGLESHNAAAAVNVLDASAPVIVCPGAISVGGPELPVAVSYAATAEDGCGPSPEVSFSMPSGSSFERGLTTVTASATDDAGNSNTCSFDVIVSCFTVNRLSMTLSDGQVTGVLAKGSFGPAVPIHLATDAVTLAVRDDQGFEVSVTIPPGSFGQSGGKPGTQRYVYASPRGSVPKIRAKLDLATCSFEVGVSKLASAGLPVSQVTASLSAGVNTGAHSVNLRPKGKSLTYRGQPAVDCCAP